MIKTVFQFGEVFPINELFESGTDKVGFKDVWHNENGGVSLLSFKKGQSLPEHLAPAEVMVYVMDGEVTFTMNGVDRHLLKGDCILMGNGVPHKVEAMSDSKVMLVKIRP